MSAKVEVEMDGELKRAEADLMVAWMRGLLASELPELTATLSLKAGAPRTTLILEAPSPEQAQQALERLWALMAQRSRG